MAKSNLILITIVCLLSFNCKQTTEKKAKTDLIKTDGLIGRIKSTLISVYTLNTNSSTPQKGKLINKILSSYDSLGSRIMTVYYNETDSITSKTSATLQYNKNAKIILEKDYVKDTLSDYLKNEYNNVGQMISTTYYKPDNSLNFKLKYVYDKIGNQIEEIKIDADGSIILKYISKYNENKNVIERKNYDYNGELQFSDNFKYDQNGNQTELTHFDKDGNQTLKNKMEYDKTGNVITIEKRQSNSDEVITQHFKYDNFDQKHNPTTALVFIGDNPAGISESVIKYY